ncbi:DMT family transporter [Enterovirga aerilata]|uniref:DMT family transporter n=1 Tax=Enterovirga aerilata TaxID=2730920 RepID=A0A849HUC3_9HYPH|nr:DMT family transporter [Enterovirga sp. DB1703]NNM71106.1 DMT family transporter [Enterovirga sp. DB1703]
MNATEWSLLVSLSLLWGGSFFFVAVAVREIPPLTLVLLRVGIAALVLNALLPLLGSGLPKTRRAWSAILVMSLLNNVAPFSLFVWAQTTLTGGAAAILNATTPLFGVLVANACLPDERLTAARVAGVMLGLAGVVVMVGPSVLSGIGQEAGAQAACLAAALSYAFAGVWGRRFAGLEVAPIQTAAGQVSVSALILLPLALGIERPWTIGMPGAASWAAVFGLATLSTALGYVIYFRILATAGATNLLLVTFLIPPSAMLLGALILGETLTLRQAGGMALIGAGLAAIDGRLVRLASGIARTGMRWRRAKRRNSPET